MRSDGNKKYLVTGGTGFLGSNLVRALVERGDAVRVLDNNFRGSATGDHRQFSVNARLRSTAIPLDGK